MIISDEMTAILSLIPSELKPIMGLSADDTIMIEFFFNGNYTLIEFWNDKETVLLSRAPDDKICAWDYIMNELSVKLKNYLKESGL